MQDKYEKTLTIARLVAQQREGSVDHLLKKCDYITTKDITHRNVPFCALRLGSSLFGVVITAKLTSITG